MKNSLENTAIPAGVALAKILETGRTACTASLESLQRFALQNDSKETDCPGIVAPDRLQSAGHAARTRFLKHTCLIVLIRSPARASTQPETDGLLR